MTPGEIHTFSAKEARHQHAFAKWRQRISLPVLRMLQSLSVSPDALSVIGILSMIVLPMAFIYNPVWSIVAYILHLLFDSLDGSLARFMGTASPRGAYLDVVVDHSSLIATILVFLWFGFADPFWVSLYVIGYLILVVHFVLMNVRGNPPTFPVVRTKYFLFLLTVLFAYGLVDPLWIDYFFCVFALYYALMSVVYIVLFRWTLEA